MLIENISLKKVNDDGKLKAICSVNFDNVFVVHGIRLVDGKNGLFLSFPARVREDQKYFDIAHPIDGDFRTLLTEKVIEEYNNLDK